MKFSAYILYYTYHKWIIPTLMKPWVLPFAYTEFCAASVGLAFLSWSSSDDFGDLFKLCVEVSYIAVSRIWEPLLAELDEFVEDFVDDGCIKPRRATGRAVPGVTGSNLNNLPKGACCIIGYLDRIFSKRWKVWII